MASGTRVRLVRSVAFSAGHRYWLPDRDAAENRRLFGPFASPYNHGHNYRLEVACEGVVDPATGMVVNIKEIDDVLDRDVVAVFDGKSINDEIPGFGARPPTLENLLLDLSGRLKGLPADARCIELGLWETDDLWATLTMDKDRTMTLTRKYEFAASHRLHSRQLTEEQNQAIFGKCNNPAGHGHNYVLEVTVSGQPDPVTGMMVDLGELDETVNRLVVDRYDHRHLNEDLPEFRDQVPTSEVIAMEIWSRLDGQVPGKLHKVRLLETARSAFEVVAP